jgi:hypothetical protein
MIPHREKTKPEAVSGVSPPSDAESGSIQEMRVASVDPKPEVRVQVSQQVRDQVPNPAPTSPSHLLDLGLQGLVIVVVAMVLGYLVGPMVEKRISPEASQRSLLKEVKASESASTDRSSTSQRLKSLPELRNLAVHGDADAQWQMGVRYHNGEGVPRDDVQAMQWFLRAAEQGHVTAQATLGAYYWAGRGVPQDLSKAYFWSALALAQGDANSKSRLEGLASQMTQPQVSAARQQAEIWIHSHSQRAKSEAN